jgi:hypothetical protein
MVHVLYATWFFVHWQAPINRVGSVMRAGQATSNNPFAVAAHLIKTEGVRRLWASNATVCLQVGPEMAANFFLYDRLKHALLADPNAPTRAEKFFVGGTAGWLAYSLTFPLLVAQFRLAVVPKGTYSGIIDLVRKTLQMEGLAGFFRGYTTASIRIFGIRGFDMVAFLALKNHFVKTVRASAWAIHVVAIANDRGSVFALCIVLHFFFFFS